MPKSSGRPFNETKSSRCCLSSQDEVRFDLNQGVGIGTVELSRNVVAPDDDVHSLVLQSLGDSCERGVNLTSGDLTVYDADKCQVDVD